MRRRTAGPVPHGHGLRRLLSCSNTAPKVDFEKLRWPRHHARSHDSKLQVYTAMYVCHCLVLTMKAAGRRGRSLQHETQALAVRQRLSMCLAVAAGCSSGAGT